MVTPSGPARRRPTRKTAVKAEADLDDERKHDDDGAGPSPQRSRLEGGDASPERSARSHGRPSLSPLPGSDDRPQERSPVRSEDSPAQVTAIR